MERCIKFFMAIVCFLLLVGKANAQIVNHLTEVNVRYDARYYPEFFYGRGGPEGHSGAYIRIIAGIDGYNDIKKIRVKAKHIASKFEVSLVGDDPECVGVWPLDGVDLYFSVGLRPQHRWMTGVWEITLKYRKDGQKQKETKTVNVPRFNFPPEPTGIQIAVDGGMTYLVWNRIGDPGFGNNQHVEYRIAHLTTPSPYCIDEWYWIREGTGNYQLWSGNRIAVELPAHWNSGDLIRIENRVYDDNSPDGPLRHDRGVRYFFLP